MKIDRAFLEDIMNNQPYGAGKQLIKGKLKRFAYIAKPYKRVYEDEVRVEVMVARESQAFHEAQQKFYKDHPEYYRDGTVEWRKAV